MYIYILTLSAFCFNVKYTLIIQQDIIFKTVSILTNLQRTVTDKKCKKVYTN